MTDNKSKGISSQKTLLNDKIYINDFDFVNNVLYRMKKSYL